MKSWCRTRRWPLDCVLSTMSNQARLPTLTLPPARSNPGSQSPAKAGTVLAGGRQLLVIIAAATLAGGLAAQLLGSSRMATWIWIGGISPVLATLIIEIVVSLRRGEVGLDIVAALSMGGSLVVNEPLAGSVVALMYAGGQYLEAFAQRRARR